ncbi:hypothetical protein H6798_03485 [Candidatus Nomurabacteria bacterium]|nr:hypothetical protein [Candidatus Nomurabacteria bacterium]
MAKQKSFLRSIEDPSERAQVSGLFTGLGVVAVVGALSEHLPVLAAFAIPCFLGSAALYPRKPKSRH